MDASNQFRRSVWFDLPVVHLSDAMSFYKGLLGWNYRQMDASVEPDYVMIEVEGTLIGGLRKVSALPKPSNSPVAPIIYFTVEKLAPQIVRAKELGAVIVGSPVDLGKDRGRYQWIRDREGHLIGLWAPQ